MKSLFVTRIILRFICRQGLNSFCSRTADRFNVEEEEGEENGEREVAKALALMIPPQHEAT